MINIGIIGYGYWGPNLVRNFFAAKDCCIKAVAEANAERLLQLGKVFPSIAHYKNANDLINNPEIDAVVIATPVFSHFRLAKQAILQGKQVLIEKPITSSVQEAEILIDLAQKMDVLLMVDH